VKTVIASGYFLTTIRGNVTGRWQLRWVFNGLTFGSRLATAVPDPPPSAR
jgi:hypothetical protein